MRVIKLTSLILTGALVKDGALGAPNKPLEHTSYGSSEGDLLEGRDAASCFSACAYNVCTPDSRTFLPGKRAFGLVVGLGCAALCACACGIANLRRDEGELWFYDPKDPMSHRLILSQGVDFGWVKEDGTTVEVSFDDYLEGRGELEASGGAVKAKRQDGGALCRNACSNRYNKCDNYNHDADPQCNNNAASACGNYLYQCQRSCY